MLIGSQYYDIIARTTCINSTLSDEGLLSVRLDGNIPLRSGRSSVIEWIRPLFAITLDLWRCVVYFRTAVAREHASAGNHEEEVSQRPLRKTHNRGKGKKERERGK
jgi:hypothetical protein